MLIIVVRHMSGLGKRVVNLNTTSQQTRDYSKEIEIILSTYTTGRQQCVGSVSSVTVTANETSQIQTTKKYVLANLRI